MVNDWYEWKLIKEKKDSFVFELVVNDEKSRKLKDKFMDGRPHFILISKIKIDNDIIFNGDDKE